MTGTDPRERVRDAQIDLLLREVEGDESPPDVVDRVLAAAAGIAPAPAQPIRRRTLLVAAIVLLGAVVTWTIAMLGRGDDAGAPDAVPAQDRTLPAPVEVDSAAALAAVPEDTIALRCVGLAGGDLAGLARLRRLRRLEILPAVLARPGSQQEVPVTDAALAHLVSLTKLEHLGLRKSGVRGHGMAQLAALPALRSLDLHGTQVDAAGLAEIARLPSLTRLDVSAIRAFGDAEMEQVLKMRGLRWLSIAGNGLIGEGMLLRIDALTQLEHLDVSRIRGGVVLDVNPLGPIVARTGDGAGVDDRVLERVAKLAKLRALVLAGCENVTGAGLAHVLQLPRLTGLDLRHCTKLTRSDLEVVVRHPKVDMLGLPMVGASADGVLGIIALLEEAPAGLRELRLSGVTPGVTGGNPLQRLAAAQVQDFGFLDRLKHLKALWIDRVVLGPKSYESLARLGLDEFRALDCQIDAQRLAPLRARARVFVIERTPIAGFDGAGRVRRR